MKKTLLILAIIALNYSCEKKETLAPNTYNINGTAKGVLNGIRAYLKNTDNPRNVVIIDTAIIINEAFSFKGKVNNASLRILTINSINGGVPFILESGKINIEVYKDSIYSSKVSGSKNNEVYNLFKIEQQKTNIAMREIRLQINEARSSSNTALSSQLIARISEMNKEIISFSHEFIEEHSDSDFALMLLEQMINGTDQELERFTSSMATLKSVINRNNRNKNIGKKVQDFIHILESQKNLEIGKIAPNFTSTTPDGKELSLNDIKGKVTIIEFWAAWCGPCRRENPNIVKVYNKYHEKGLEIIGVSLDGTGRQKDPKAIWLKAIEDDKLTWHQVSSLQYFNDPVAKLYNINSIPASFILDEDGKIVAKRLRGQALEDQIASMLD